ncbi:MAG: hypothetical protein IJQ31_04440 [Thermoguttaceae bacterium]|nr:hypothetical protein [Thermoguttaceae bacterium]
MAYDTIENEFLDLPKLQTEPPLEFPQLEKFEPGFPEDKIRHGFELSEEYSGPNVVIGEIQSNGVEWQWKTETISAELKDGQVSIQGKTPAFTQFLNNLPKEVIEKIFSWSSKTDEPVIINLETIKADRITPLAKFPSRKEKADVVLRSESNQNSPFQPNFLEILLSPSTDAPYLEYGQNGEPAKLHISALKDWNEESVSDLKKVLSPVTARLFYNGTPILADFVVEEHLSNKNQAQLTNLLITELLQAETSEDVGPAEICAFALLLDPQNEAVVDFLLSQNDLETTLEQIRKHAKHYGFDPETLWHRLQEKLDQPTNLTQAIKLYHRVPKSLLAYPEMLFRDRIAEEIVRSIWNRPQDREQLSKIPQIVPLCQLSNLLDNLQRRLGIPMLKPDIELPPNVALGDFSRLCTEWLDLYQNVMGKFSTQETFCEDLRQSVQNLKKQADERIKEASSRIVLVLDIFALLEAPEILSYQIQNIKFAIPNYVRLKLENWKTNEPEQKANRQRALDLMQWNKNILVFEDSNPDQLKIMDFAERFRENTTYVVTNNRKLIPEGKARNIRVLFPWKCLDELQKVSKS